MEDTRYFLKSRDDVDEEKEAFLYKREKELKKLDHKNRGKMHTKQKFLNLNLKTNLATLNTPNLKLSLTVRAIGLPFQIAEFLEKQAERMQRLFTPLPDILNVEQEAARQRIVDQRNQLVKEILGQFD